jgi:AbrB family looped-hinge helix DNA binding protein
MIRMITTVTGKNQITIPAKLAVQLDIQPGTRVEWSISEDGLLVARPLPRRGELARRIAGMGRSWLPEKADPIADLIRERAKDDEDEGLA